MMKHQVKVTVIDKKCYPELQHQYCVDPQAGPCPCYNVGDTFIFRRDDERDDFWHMGLEPIRKQLPAVQCCRIVLKPGMPSAGIFTRDCRVAVSCVAG